ncbi:DUF4835 family protein [Flavobacterium sp. MFBS3-15]|uniref:type IX secretion system protein PorD n=1 Tax=Flavobacterium sp. MFBS3-15 TaxID=2989816 RepID=UPI0022366636|nr:DUF4835 family protein [Flavobacterium sp. MFBS3-15]MCW4468947.1 DUF4835 family protein [Flavobacterium sp. MFBS3-15]
MYKYIAMLLLVFSFGAKGQELNCRVQVNYQMITDANPQIFKTLEKSLGDFVNNTRWTNRDFGRSERIDCTMIFTITAYESNSFSSSLQVQSSRPVYGSTYSSPILNFNDKDVNFRYTEGENLIYNPNSFDSNLVAVVSFYANVIIGLDADSFAKSGGTDYYQAAQNMAVLAQGGGYKGWNQQDGNQSRYFLINDVLSNTYTPWREALYNYHINGLDRMSDNQKEAKEKTIAAIKGLGQVHSTRPNSFLMRIFFDAKADEVVNIFSGGPAITVTELVDTLNRISPLNGSKWNNIR